MKDGHVEHSQASDHGTPAELVRMAQGGLVAGLEIGFERREVLATKPVDAFAHRLAPTYRTTTTCASSEPFANRATIDSAISCGLCSITIPVVNASRIPSVAMINVSPENTLSVSARSGGSWNPTTPPRAAMAVSRCSAVLSFRRRTAPTFPTPIQLIDESR